MVQDFITLLRTVCNVRRMNCLLLEFSMNGSWPQVTETVESEMVDKGGARVMMSLQRC